MNTNDDVHHSIAGYLCYARDQIPTLKGDMSRWGATACPPFEDVADMVAQVYKQCGQRFRRQLTRDARSPHPFFPDPTPYECQVLIDALCTESRQPWCLDECAAFEEFDEDDAE